MNKEITVTAQPTEIELLRKQNQIAVELLRQTLSARVQGQTPKLKQIREFIANQPHTTIEPEDTASSVDVVVIIKGLAIYPNTNQSMEDAVEFEISEMLDATGRNKFGFDIIQVKDAQ